MVISINKLYKKNWGFTLIELLVSISIIATLTAILLPNFLGAREKAKDTQKKSELVAIKNALRMYYNDNQGYPTVANLQTALTTYAPQMVASNIGFSYDYVPAANGESFLLCVELDAPSGTEAGDSQAKCAPLSGNCVDTSVPAKKYVVCAN